MPSKKYKKLKQPNTEKPRNNSLTYDELEEMMSGLTEEEINLLSDWLSSLPQNSSGR